MSDGARSPGVLEIDVTELPDIERAPIGALSIYYGGERGIRTLDRVLAYTPLAGVRLQPLGQLSGLTCCRGLQQPIWPYAS